MNSNPQSIPFRIVVGALGYVTRSDLTATSPKYLVSGSQNVLINETITKKSPARGQAQGEEGATDEEGDKIETRAGYELFGAASTDRNDIVSEFVFKTKVGDTVMGRMDDNGDLEYYSEESDAWETLLTGLDGSYPFRTVDAWNGTELLRVLLGVNHSSTLYEWTGATATYASSTTTTIVINETIATRGFWATGSTAKIRVKDSGGTWREFTVTSHTGSTFTVTEDPTAFTFTAAALVVQSVRTNASTPAAGFTNDVIGVLQNHVYVGSHSSSIIYMSDSTSYIDFTFSSPRVATEGAQLVLDAFAIGFETNVAGSGEESMVIFAGNDWIYRVQFTDIADTAIAQIIKVAPILVSSGQGAVRQELIGKMKNSIVFINGYNELLELGSIEDKFAITQTPLSDPIKPDFLAATFTGGAIRFWRNNLYVTAPASGRMFILAFREDSRGSRRFWQPPQLLPVGQMSDYGGNLIGHGSALTESYTLFTGTNDNGQPIAFKAHFAYSSFGARDKMKNFDKYFTEMYLTSNTTVNNIFVYEYLGSKAMRTFQYKGTDSAFIFTPDPAASLGVNSLGTSPLGGSLSEIEDFLKYRRFKKVTAPDFFEIQVRYEADELDAQFQLLAHGPNVIISKNAPAKLTS